MHQKVRNLGLSFASVDSLLVEIYKFSCSTYSCTWSSCEHSDDSVLGKWPVGGPDWAVGGNKLGLTDHDLT
jgi:hypothetical protein